MNIEQTAETELIMLMKEYGFQKKYKKNDFIFRLHEYAKHLYFIEEGWVKISKDGGEGRPVTLLLHQTGEFFGMEEPVAQVAQREREAYCLTNCSILSIDIKTFFSILKEKPSLLLTISSSISKQLLYAQHFIEELMSKSVAQRLAGLLIHFSSRRGDSLMVKLPVTHEELSFIIGCSRQSVTELLNVWRKQGIIDYQKRKITILDANAMLSFPFVS